MSDPAGERRSHGDKASIREELQLADVEWQSLASAGDDPDAPEYSFVPHADGVTYVALRRASDPDGLVLVFTPSEWDAFLSGVRDGEFDLPA